MNIERSRQAAHECLDLSPGINPAGWEAVERRVGTG